MPGWLPIVLVLASGMVLLVMSWLGHRGISGPRRKAPLHGWTDGTAILPANCSLHQRELCILHYSLDSRASYVSQCGVILHGRHPSPRVTLADARTALTTCSLSRWKAIALRATIRSTTTAYVTLGISSRFIA
ncbi:hypothetical protein BDW69DRAFT_157139 [Aspergillus filifer]